MKRRSEKPREPVAMHETIRREILQVLTEGRRSARELSAEVRISEKEIYDHLEHLRKSLAGSDRHLIVTPAECRKCGFLFSKRERLKKPGRCPVCRGESILEPTFGIEEKD